MIETLIAIALTIAVVILYATYQVYLIDKDRFKSSLQSKKEKDTVIKLPERFRENIRVYLACYNCFHNEFCLNEEGKQRDYIITEDFRIIFKYIEVGHILIKNEYNESITFNEKGEIADTWDTSFGYFIPDEYTTLEIYVNGILHIENVHYKLTPTNQSDILINFNTAGGGIEKHDIINIFVNNKLYMAITKD